MFFLNLNELFSYSFIFATPVDGFSQYLYRVFRSQNLDFSPLSPFIRIENVYALVQFNEVNIMSVQMYSYEFFLYLLTVAAYSYLSFIHSVDSRAAEFGIHPRTRSISADRLAHFGAGLPSNQFLQLQRTLRKPQNLATSGRCRIWLSKMRDSIAAKREVLLFGVFQVLSIDVVHLSVKSLKLMAIIRPTPSLVFLCAYYHSILAFLVAETARAFGRHREQLSRYITEGNSLGLKTYVVILTNSPLLALTLVYVYVLLLCSNRVSQQNLSNVCFVLFAVYVWLRSRIRVVPRYWNLLRIVSN